MGLLQNAVGSMAPSDTKTPGPQVLLSHSVVLAPSRQTSLPSPSVIPAWPVRSRVNSV